MIRKVTQEDIPDILELELRGLGPVWDEAGIEPDLDSLRSFTESRINLDRMILFQDERGTLGFLHSVGYTDIVTHAPVREIVSVVVHPDHFGQGIGSLLIEDEYMHCKREGVGFLKIEVLSSNQRGISFYQRNGFTEIKRIMLREVDSGEDVEE